MIPMGTQAASPSVPVSTASFPTPFASGLEFSAPARGVWTIVHVGMLIPEAHEIFICAAGCLRGVVLSAAEMNLTHRFSTVAITEQNVLDGDMEQLLTEGVSDILHRLPQLPKAVLVYSSCIHHFMGCDFALCIRELRKRFPTVDFTDCYMTPTMRKSGFTPDQLMRRQLYSLLKPTTFAEKHCAIIGNCFSLSESSDLVRLIHSAGWTLHQITDCQTYADYQEMAKCSICISTQATARIGGDTLAQRLGMRHLYLPVCYGAAEIRSNLHLLADALGTVYDDGIAAESDADSAMMHAKSLLGDTPLAIDYTVSPRPLGLARLLLRYGFRVEKLFADAFSGEEHEDFLWLRTHAPNLKISPTVHSAMRRVSRGSTETILALGQKAAYFTDSPHFVDLVENGGLYGFDGIRQLAELIEDAFITQKDPEQTIQIKGLGCESCL